MAGFVRVPVSIGSCAVEAPEGAPAEVLALAARAAVSTVAAAAASGRLRYRTAGLPRSVIEAHLGAWSAGERAYEVVADRARAQLAAAARIGVLPDEPAVDDVAAALFDGAMPDVELARLVGESVGKWARQVAGHPVGRHDGSCEVCLAATRGQWRIVLERCGVSERLLLDLYHAAVAAGAMPAIPRRLAGGLSLEDLF